MLKSTRALACGAVLGLAANAAAFDRTESYAKTNVAGFAILLAAKLQEHPEARDEALREFASQAGEIEAALEPGVLKRLQKTPIWMEWQAKTNGAAEYHPSREWLAGNGYNPEKAKAIEISNARNFVKWSRQDQPSMLLHELAHAFHDQVLGWDDADVQAAFRQAAASGRYESVRHANGRTARAYALTDAKEYFAELSEAYLGRNDFFPFARAELMEFDPAGFAVLKEKWKAPAAPAAAIAAP
jgi:hypothetical protein